MVSESFKTEDAASYDNVADSFDDLTERYAMVSAQTLARHVAGRRRVLDIGCGTGIVAFAAARGAAEVTGVDLSDGMLRIAQAKAEARNLAGRVSFRRGDAEALDLPDGRFDACVSLNAFSHFPDPRKAAEEAFRVLAPGGLIAVAIGSGPQLATGAGMRRAVSAVLSRLRKGLGREQSACDQLERLVTRHLSPEREVEIAQWARGRRDVSGLLGEVFAGAGFADVRRSWVGADFDIATTEAFWRLQTTISSPARKAMARASEADLAALKAAFWRECETVLSRGGRLSYRIGAAIVTGAKPGLSAILAVGFTQILLEAGFSFSLICSVAC